MSAQYRHPNNDAKSASPLLRLKIKPARSGGTDYSDLTLLTLDHSLIAVSVKILLLS